MKKTARDANGEVVSVYWIPENTKAHEILNDRIKKSIGYYREWFPKLADSHKVELGHIREFRVDIFRKKNHQIEIRYVVTDDRGKEISGAVQH